MDPASARARASTLRARPLRSDRAAGLAGRRWRSAPRSAPPSSPRRVPRLREFVSATSSLSTLIHDARDDGLDLACKPANLMEKDCSWQNLHRSVAETKVGFAMWS